MDLDKKSNNRGRDFKTEIEQWLKKHPNGTRKDCAHDLKTSTVTIGTYINQYNIPFKCNKIIQEEETYLEITKWLKNHPNGTRKDCANDLKLCEYTISKYEGKYNLKFHIPKRNRQRDYASEIKIYCKENPSSNVDEIANELNINKNTLRKYLKELKIKPKRKKPDYLIKEENKNKEAIATYLKNNKGAKRKEISVALGLSYSKVSRLITKFNLK